MSCCFLLLSCRLLFVEIDRYASEKANDYTLNLRQ